VLHYFSAGQTFLLAKVAVPRQMIADILSLIARLRSPPTRP
jgi:hypothetical protein